MKRAPFMLTADEWLALRMKVGRRAEPNRTRAVLDAAMSKVYAELVVKPGADQFAEDQLDLPLVS